jgi:hypothetical protein
MSVQFEEMEAVRPSQPKQLSHCLCGQPVFFGNLVCVTCGSDLGFDPISNQVQAIVQDNSIPGWTIAGPEGRRVQRCANANSPAACNWLIEDTLAPGALCVSCSLTQIVPDLSIAENAVFWGRIESAKRRLVAALIALRLPLDGLTFQFLATIPGTPRVLTGHSSGVITLNIEEADDAIRERVRVEMREPYRTLLGHLRHESGHFYWTKLIENNPRLLDTFRLVFGDERADYGEALRNYHLNGSPFVDWQSSFLSAYATAHPHEDWAETWAHYLHMREGLDSAGAMGVAIEPERLSCQPFPESALLSPEEDPTAAQFLEDLNRWCALSTVVNELNRSLGQPDFYPFVLSQATVRKLHLVHLAITLNASSHTPHSSSPNESLL